MKLTTKINLYIIVVCIVIIVAVKYQTDKQKEFVELYITRMVEQKEVLFNTVMDLRGEPYKRVLEENSLWDELIKFIDKHDNKWAKENINTMLDVHRANAVWIFNNKNEVVYSVNNSKDSGSENFSIQYSYVPDLFKETKFPHFFAVTKNGLMEIFGASVHPTNDFERSTPPSGYFFVGKLWDSKYENSIEQIVDCSINIIYAGEKDTISSNILTKTFSKDIQDPISGKNIASIKVSKDIRQLKDIEKLSRNTFSGIMIFFVVLVLVTGFIFWLWFIVPLNKISDTLNTNDIEPIKRLIKDKSVFGNITKMIVEFFKQKKEIEISEKKFKDMFEHHGAVMLLLDPKSGKIIDANNSAEKFYCYKVEQLKKMNISEIDTMDVSKLKSELGKSLHGETNYFLYRHKLSSGEIRDVEVYSTPIVFGEGKVLFVIVHDISKRKEAEEELLLAKNEAEKAALMKAQFLSNMSHEIRTPLNAIIGLTNLMMSEGDIDEKKKENMNAIKFSADHLHSIINDILDYSKIEAGKVSIEKIDFNLYELVANTVKTFELKTKEKGLFLKTSIGDNIPKMIKGDPVRLKQIIINLIGNAVKFTENGGIELKVDTLNSSGNKIELNFKVIDSGIGITETKIAKIFESFTQAYEDTTRKFGGTGLGLAITKRLIELQGGRIKVESETGKGSIFGFNLVFEISENQNTNSDEKKSHHHKDLAGIKLLLAEDNKMNQFFAKQLFAKWKINVDVADNGLIAVDLLKKNNYDIVLLDLQMPEMNGFEVVEIIRDRNSEVLNHNIPVIALTADISPDTNKKVNSSGMNDFVLKPFEQNELYSKIAKFII
jgi:PAS domain S-box-containing protein